MPTNKKNKGRKKRSQLQEQPTPADANIPPEKPSLTPSEQRRQERISKMVNGHDTITARRLAMVFPDLGELVNETCVDDELTLAETVIAKIICELPENDQERLLALLVSGNNEILLQVLLAIKGIRHRQHLAPELACWYCDQETRKSSRVQCKGCKVAMYCNRDCRKQHRIVHQPSCNEIGHFFHLMADAQSDADRAVSDPESHSRKYGIKPSGEDHFIAMTGISVSGFHQNQKDEVGQALGHNPSCGVQGPSMEYFYRNVQHAVHDGFWFCPPSGKPDSLKQGEDTVVIEDREMWLLVSCAMMFNHTDPEGKLRWDWFQARLGKTLRAVGKQDKMAEALAWSASNWFRFYHPATATTMSSFQKLYRQRIILGYFERYASSMHFQIQRGRPQCPNMEEVD